LGILSAVAGVYPEAGLALAAAIAITAIKALEETQRYLSDSREREALGHQAVQYQVPEPDAMGPRPQ
jgi:hypothetical protein